MRESSHSYPIVFDPLILTFSLGEKGTDEFFNSLLGGPLFDAQPDRLLVQGLAKAQNAQCGKDHEEPEQRGEVSGQHVKAIALEQQPADRSEEHTSELQSH